MFCNPNAKCFDSLFYLLIDCVVVKHALSKHENVCELKREANDAKLEAVALQNRLTEVHGELLRSEKK